MHLQGSCHCGAVNFNVQSAHPYPFNLCYCSVCRKTAGADGFAINLSGDCETLEVQGKEHVKIYQARIDGQLSPAQRHFCQLCAGEPLIKSGWCLRESKTFTPQGALCREWPQPFSRRATPRMDVLAAPKGHSGPPDHCVGVSRQATSLPS